MSKINLTAIFVGLFFCGGAWAQPAEKTLGEMNGGSINMPSPLPQAMTALVTPPQELRPNAAPVIQLVGIYAMGSNLVAEFSLDGKVRYAYVDDEFKDNWVIKRITKSHVELERCAGSSKCKTKTMKMEVD